MKFILISFACCLLFFFGSLAPTLAQSRPNILIIIADDMGTDAFAPYGLGTDLPNTPNLNQWASQGLLFQNAWSYATCAPSRASLLTGRYGNKTGVVRSGLNLPVDQLTFFEQLEIMLPAVYSNAVFGKWHLGGDNHPNNQGVQHYDGHLSSGVADYFNWERTINGVTSTSTEYATTALTDQAINWLDNQTQPWLLWAAYNAPHSPFHFPPDSLYTRTQTNNNFDRYLCMIESVDHEAARIYHSLTQAEKDSTLLIFVGDNGTPNSKLQAYPDGHAKGSIYEGGIRVPMFMMGYGVDRINEQEDALVSFSDVFATLTELLGTDLPGGRDNSLSFLPLLSDPNAPSRTYNYSEIEEDQLINRAIRNERYKLILFGDSTQEMYDLLADPLEETDLLLGTLTNEQEIAQSDLQQEADSLFYSWSCRDDIQNGDETDIDCGGSVCEACTSTALEGEPTLAQQIVLFPNPSRDYLHLSLPAGIYTVEVYDLQGRLLTEKNQTEGACELDLREFPRGVYLLVVKAPNKQERVMRKIVKE